MGLEKRAREDSNLRPAVSATPAVIPPDRTISSPERVLGRRALPQHPGGHCGAGVLLGQLTRWSLHLPSIAWECDSRTPIADLARDCPPREIRGVGFPEFTRFASGRYRPGPLLAEGNRRSIQLSYERKTAPSMRTIPH
jgi:hypothetical protein